MAKRVFFSFHYENDVWRANVVRNSWVTKGDFQTAGYVDKAEFEEVKRKGDANVKKWIREQLDGTSVTVVLIGSETNQREYVQYELQTSYERGNTIFGIYVHQIKDQFERLSNKGSNNFGIVGYDKYRNPVHFNAFRTYDWIYDNGYQNLGTWVRFA